MVYALEHPQSLTLVDSQRCFELAYAAAATSLKRPNLLSTMHSSNPQADGDL